MHDRFLPGVPRKQIQECPWGSFSHRNPESEAVALYAKSKLRVG